MVIKIETIKNLIEYFTAYTGVTTRLNKTFQPNKISEDFVVLDAFDNFNNHIQHHKRYNIICKASSQEALETMVEAIIQIATGNPNGYEGEIVTEEIIYEASNPIEDVTYIYDDPVPSWALVNNTDVELDVVCVSSLPPDAAGTSAMLRFPLGLNADDDLQSLIFRLYTVDAIDSVYTGSLSTIVLETAEDPNAIATDPSHYASNAGQYAVADTDDFGNISADADGPVNFDITACIPLLTDDASQITMEVTCINANNDEWHWHSANGGSSTVPQIIATNIIIGGIEYPYWISATEVPLPDSFKYKPTQFRTMIQIEGRWEI